MDHEIVIPTSSMSLKGWDMFRYACNGLPFSLGLGIFMVLTTAVQVWNIVTCIVGLFAAVIFAVLRDSSPNRIKSYHGAWMMVLHSEVCLAILALGLHDPLKQLGLSRLLALLELTDYICSCLTPLLILAVITLLFIFGLERSRLLRTILHRTVFTFMLVLNVANFWWVIETSGGDIPEVRNMNMTLSLELSKVMESAAFLSTIYFGTMENVSSPITVSSFFSMCLVTYFCTTTFLFLILFVDTRYCNVSFFNAITYSYPYLLKEKTRQFWFFRDSFAVISVVCMSLSLVEVFSVCLKAVLDVVKFFLPPRIFDGHLVPMRIIAIIFTGSVSALFIAFSYHSKDLLFLCSCSYFLSYILDMKLMMFERYQAVYTHPKPTEENRDYLALDNIEPIEQEYDANNAEVVSSDSGHSSDTDIDAAVHEYRDAEEVARPEMDPLPPRGLNTCESIQIRAIIVVMVAMSGVFGFTVDNPDFALVNGTSLLIVMMCIIIIWDYPTILRMGYTRSLQPSPWKPCLNMSIASALFVQLILPINDEVIYWLFIGCIALYIRKHKEMNQRTAKIILFVKTWSKQILPSWCRLCYKPSTRNPNQMDGNENIA